MPRTLLLVLVLLGYTLVVPIFVWGNSGSFRKAVGAWWFFVRYMLVLMVPAAIAALIGLLP